MYNRATNDVEINHRYNVPRGQNKGSTKCHDRLFLEGPRALKEIPRRLKISERVEEYSKIP